MKRNINFTTFKILVIFFLWLSNCASSDKSTLSLLHPKEAALCCQNCCAIEGTCYLLGAIRADYPCQICDPNGSGGPLAWSFRLGTCDDLDSCTEPDECQDGECVGQAKSPGSICDDYDACTEPDTCNEQDKCVGNAKTCELLGDDCAGFTCGEEGLCVDPEQRRCVSGNSCVPIGTTDPIKTCWICDPDLSAQGWTEKSAGTLCGQPGACVSNGRTANLRLPDTCDAYGICQPGQEMDCSTYATCDADGFHCATSCVDADACVATAQCVDGQCVSNRAVGEVCASDLQCALRFCRQGFCCEESCDGVCMACAESVTGLPDGWCRPVKAHQDPKNNCQTSTSSSCQENGECNGSGGCELYSERTACGVTSCSAFNELLGWHCDGWGQCLDGPSVSCFPGVCQDGQCKDECSEDRQCAPKAWCDKGLCSAANRPPIAVLTGPAKALAGSKITLSGADSYDPDQDVLTYEFQQVSGPSAEIDTTLDKSSAKITLPPLKKDRVLVFQLIVFDQEIASEPAELFVQVRVVKLPSCLGCLFCGAVHPGIEFFTLLLAYGWWRNRRRALRHTTRMSR